MSNHKKGYGWSGHILLPQSEEQSSVEHNVIAIPDEIFSRIKDDYEKCKLDTRISVKQLGFTADFEITFMAIGTGFSEGFEFYGTPFIEAELRAERHPLERDLDADYLTAMKDIYGLELPRCRLMIGCSSEH